MDEADRRASLSRRRPGNFRPLPSFRSTPASVWRCLRSRRGPVVFCYQRILDYRNIITLPRHLRGFHRQAIRYASVLCQAFSQDFPSLLSGIGLFLVFITGPSRRLLWYALYLNNWYVNLGGEAIHPLGHFWSLAVEEQFYLVWPFLMLFAPRRYLSGICISMSLISVIWRAAYLKQFLPFGDSTTGACLDSLGIGALLAIWHFPGMVTPGREKILRWALWAGSSGTLIFRVAANLHLDHISGAPRYVLDGTFENLLFVWLVHKSVAGFGGLAGSMLSARPVLYVGRISYGVYVYHPFMPSCLHYLFAVTGIPFPSSEIVQFGFYVTSAIALAALSWKYFERPINDLKRYFPYRKVISEVTPTPARAFPASASRQ